MMIGRPEQSQVLSHVQWVVTALWSSDQRDWRPVQSSSTRHSNFRYEPETDDTHAHLHFLSSTFLSAKFSYTSPEFAPSVL